MWSIFFGKPTIEKDDLLTLLWERGTKGVIEEEGGLRAFFEDEVRVEEVATLGGGACAPVTRAEVASGPPVELTEWDPIFVGERFYIASARSKQAAPNGRLWLKIDSPIAFGTGRHETTQLCLQAMERVAKAGQAVADVGCGSGILSAAAGLLGASRVWSCDIEAAAVEAARNTVKTPVFLGSADALRDESADVVLANISAKVLDRLAFDLKRVVKKNGVVIISGFVGNNVPQFYCRRDELEVNDWLCWVCEPGDIRPKADTAGMEGLRHEEQWWI
ncbi:MAG TPA: 50S ribosomal protein L11 methyltransferase [Bryobacteraceae bacterium]|nr:50S ribosomal protein L11 methyltransferase [Bryobacteraceae bacterium]